jgi:surfeit locus 1 family protein
MTLAMPTSTAPARRVLVLVAALVAVAITARLGVWQWDRAAQKVALQATQVGRAELPAVGTEEVAMAAQSASDLLYRRVHLRGHWLPERTVYLENRQMNGRPGFFVVTPLQWSGGALLVQRGWAPRDNDERTRLPTLVTPAGEVDVSGRIAPPPARLYEFSAAASGVIRQNLDPASYSREIGLALLPVSVLQDDASAADALLRQWPAPAFDVHKHYAYAAQWWAMSALITGLYVWYQLIRPRLDRHAR